MHANVQSGNLYGVDDESKTREAAYLDLMIQRLDGFRSGELRLNRVLADLEELLDELRITDAHWKAEFRDVWEELHARYAVALDRQGSVPTATDDETADAVEQLNHLIRVRLEILR